MLKGGRPKGVRGAVAVLLVLLAGCLVPGQPAPSDPVPLGESQGTWGSWGGPLAVQAWSYSFVGREPDGYGPPTTLVAVDAAGRALLLTYAYALDGRPSALTFSPRSLDVWQPVVQPLFADGFLLGGGPGRVPAVRVQQVQGATVGPQAWLGVRAALEHGLATARPPTPEEQATVDCGELRLRMEEDSVALDCAEGGGGWQEVRQQMTALLRWMRGDD
ncbi:MAG: hypothetical protein QOI63_1427 [Thermoplasmata archaeon]|jgi:hypothetical protein|nr:hypothetical protein [Thermoplasmata archaeon]